MKKLLLFAAGVDEEVLDRCSSHEKNKYQVLGTLVYVPLATSMIAVFCASRYFTHNLIAVIAAGVFWGALVFLIERALISSIRPHTVNFAVIFRVITALVMSVIVSELLILFLFQDHVAEHISRKAEDEIRNIHTTYGGQVDALQEGLRAYAEELSLQEKSLIEEIEGSGGSMRRGDGRVAAEKRKALDRKKALFEEEKQRVSNEVAALRQQEAQSVESCNERHVAGLLGSIVGLHHLAGVNKTVLAALIAFHIFFLCIELMPLVIKITYQGTQYYDMVDMEESQHLSVARQLSEDKTRALLVEGQYQLRMREKNLDTQSVSVEMVANNEQFSAIAESFLLSAQKVSDLKKQAESTVDEDKQGELSKRLDELYAKMLQTVDVNVYA